MEAQEWCRKYMKSGNVKDLTQAWDLYYHVFRRISKQLPQVGSGGSCLGCLSAECLVSSWAHPVHLASLVLKSLGQAIPCCYLMKEKYLNCASVPLARQKSKSFPNYSQLTSLELQYVSPKLLMCRDLELAVPGTYDPNQPIIRIQSIAPSLQVITSKQRPRKLTLMGKDQAHLLCPA